MVQRIIESLVVFICSISIVYFVNMRMNGPFPSKKPFRVYRNEMIELNDHLHFPIEIRFSNEEWNSSLSPSFGRQTYWINTVAYRPYGFQHSKHRKDLDEFEKICFEHEGRPH